MKKSQARALAAQALHAAVREDWPAVRKAFAGISADGSAVTLALAAWCDTAIAAQDRMLGRPGPGFATDAVMVRPGWLDTGTGRLILDADEMPPAARWAGRVLAARAAMDDAQFAVLLGTMPGDGFTRGEYAAALLRGCAGVVSLAAQKGEVW